MDRNELKIQALLERISTITSSYENQDAERRIDITILTGEKQDLLTQVEELTAQVTEVRQELENVTATYVGEEAVGDVPQEENSDTSN